jgi:hypothetical protein
MRIFPRSLKGKFWGYPLSPIPVPFSFLITVNRRNPEMDDRKNSPRLYGNLVSKWMIWLERWAIGSVIALAIFLGGCAQTERAGKVETSGFMSDYSLLSPGGEGEALFVYRNPQADFSKYRTVAVEPIIVLLSEESSVSQEELNQLAADLRAKVIWKLKEDFLVVPKLIPQALRVELALTEAVPANVGMNVVSTLVPPAGIISAPTRLASGTRAFVGRASVEAKITDGDTGTLLAAAVDRRMGGRTLDGVMDSWDDVRQAFDYWANTLAQRLREWRGTTKSSVEMKE